MEGNQRFEKYLGVSVIVVCIVVYSVWLYNDHVNKGTLKGNYEFSIGRITEYGSIGTMKSYYLTYQYGIKEIDYTKESSAPYKKFPKCEYDLSLCSEKRFWVAYQKDDPANSLINLDIEIQGVENPIPPETLEGFR